MKPAAFEATAAWVGRAHGLDGSFYAEDPRVDLVEGMTVHVAGEWRVVERSAGTPERPLLRVSGIADRDAAASLYGERLGVEASADRLDDDEYRVADLVGLTIAGLGEVRRVLPAPSCDLLEVGEAGHLVPLVSDAIERIDLEGGVIEVDRRFLGLDDDPGTR